MEMEDSASKTIALEAGRVYPNQIMLPRHIEKLVVCDNGTESHEEEYLIFSRFFLTSLGNFSSLKILEISCLYNTKRLFSPNCVPPNLKQLEVSYCGQLEEIIAEERGRVTMEFSFPRLKEMSLKYLPELKSICSVDAVMICESLERLDVKSCPKLKRMRFKLPQVEPSSPLELAISLEAMELFESIEWADPDFKLNLIRKLRPF